ncbi:amino acid adenylation domain-containing protein [Micromonospora radicis]|uniref:amino acid adenylation domain-containing protein n=1 Tax=Micromonospora radicis TaxID=1894971 RepID=UPI001314EF5E|nr:amino acid adenylation domain-containing protein [Micromonospora radicis]
MAGTVDGLFDRIARRTPAAEAVRATGVSWTYERLRVTAERIGAALASLGVTRGAVVGLIGHRSAEACAAMLGVLKAGAAYLPLDDRLPSARLRRMTDTARPVVAIRLPSSRAVLDDMVRCVDYPALAAHHCVTPPHSAHSGADPAYLMFTSGTAGRPKAVVVPHRAVLRTAVDNLFLELGPGDRMMHGATISFDAATLELWLPLLNGASVLVVDNETLLSALEFQRWLAENEPTAVFLTTGILHQLAHDRPGIFAGLPHLLTGGEALNPRLVRRILQHGPPGRFVNAYGPTEATVLATTHTITAVAEDATAVPIGLPIGNTSCLVLSADGSPVPPGVEGELHIGGAGLALGYLGDDEQTARSFVTVLLDGVPQQLYRTGDLACRDDDGVLHFRGRRDHQVKVRGNRLELDEIRQALNTHEAVTDSALVTVEDAVSRHVVAYYTCTDPAPDMAGLRRHLARDLPRYAIPSAFHRLAVLPLTPTGKVDLDRLRQLAATTARPTERTGLPNSDDIAARVAHSWSLVLPQGDPASDEDFFGQGGDSLRAAQLINRIVTTLKIDLTQSRPLLHRLLADPRLPSFTGAVSDAVSGTLDTEETDEADRWQRDLYLHPTVRQRGPAAAAPSQRAPRRILLTGATGFFGSYLLRGILQHTGADVVCLARADDDDHALARVHDAQRRYGHPGTLPRARVTAVAGDLRRRHLGWSDVRWRELTGTVDAIHHSAAHVNFVYPYEELRPTNVDGVRNLIEFAMSGRDVPFHYVSTIAVLAGFGSAGIRHVGEDQPLEHFGRLSMGYPESKWVAEQLLRRAAADGLPVVVHRPYEITGDSSTGVWNTEAAICALFKAIVEMGSAPDIDLPLDFVPADYLAAAITFLTGSRGSAGRTYHLTNPRPGRLADMIDRMRARGYRITVTRYDQWVKELVDFVDARPRHPIAAFVPIFTLPAAARDFTVKELYTHNVFPQAGRSHADRDLVDLPVTCPATDAAMLDRYLDYFARVGFLGNPPGWCQ